MQRLGLALLAFLLLPACQEDTQRIRIVGSSTVYPFIAVVAERFGSETEFYTPVVEATGTGGGFKLFCSGAGPDTPDISNASRPIKDSELELCRKAGVIDPIEITIGHDGIVLATSRESPLVSFTTRQLFLALAKEVPGKNGTLIPNPYKQWHDVDASMPERAIEVYGPPPTSGTRDSFVELVMHEACNDFPEFKKAYADKEAHKRGCGMLREDGAFIEAGENDNIIVQKLVSNPGSFGLFGFSFYEENAGKVQVSSINGVAPDLAAIASGKYPVARSLFVYAKREHLGKTPGLIEFLEMLTSANTLGETGNLTLRGLVPVEENWRIRDELKIKAARSVIIQLNQSIDK